MPTPIDTGPPIPAMTTDAERACYYRLAKEAAAKGVVVELGAWMGASTAYIAAGVRDAGGGSVYVFDKFQSKPGHIRKVKEFYDRQGIEKVPVGPCLEAFKDNLGNLAHYVSPVAGQIEQTTAQKWADDSISLLVTDAPKRVPAISAVLTNLRTALQPGAIMAWQDFCHFPSYEIAACLYRLRDHIEFVEAVVPGTTLVFRLKSQWSAAEVSPEALSLARWTSDEVFAAWHYWLEVVPAEKANLFRCGGAMFLADIGKPKLACASLRPVSDARDVRKKWSYLRANRPDFLKRYQPLFAIMAHAA